MKNSVLRLILSLSLFCSASIPQVLFASEQKLTSDSIDSKNDIDSEELTVDEETRTPEGSSHARNTTYIKVGQQFKSSNSSIPISLVEQIREIALKSEAKSKVDPSEFGITKESVEKNRDVMLRSAFAYDFRKPTEPPPFDSLPAEIQKLFEYETVAKNALAELTQSMNSAYNCVVFSIPGNPKIQLISRHRQVGMLPWLVRCEGRSWLTYDRSLPPLLAKVASEKSRRALSDEKLDFRMQDYKNKDAQKAKTWADAFFSRYETYSLDQVSSYQDRELAKSIPGWSLVSDKFSIEDAKRFNSGSFDIQVNVLVPGAVVNKIRWRAEKEYKGSIYSPDWSELWKWYQQIESAAEKTVWMDKWRKESANRSILAMQRLEIPEANDEKRMKWADKGPCEAWQNLGLEGRPKYCFRLLENGIHKKDAFIGSPYRFSLVTNLGPNGGPTASLPQIFRGSSVSVLRMQEQEGEKFSIRIQSVINQEGSVVKQSSTPLSYALRANFPAPNSGEEEFDYSWPVDPSANEDIEYLDKKFDGEGEIVSFNFVDEPTLQGLVNKAGKIIVPPIFRYIGPLSCGLSTVKDQTGKVGYLDHRGEIKIKPQFDSAETFYEGLAAVGKGEKYGFMNTDGELVIPLIFDSVRRFSEGVAAVRKGTKFGFIDKTGKVVIQPQFGRARHFIDGLAYVQVDGKRAYIGHSGMPIGGKFYDVLHRFSDDRAMFYTDGKYGFIDRKGREILPLGITSASDFRDGVAVVKVGNDRKAIDKEGKFVPAPVSHSDFWQGPIKEDLVIYRNDHNKYGFSNRLGKIVIEPIFESVGVFDGGICPAEINGHWGVINRTGEFVLKPQFDGLDRTFSEGKIAFRLGEKWGVIDSKGHQILKPKFDKIYPYENGMAVFQDGVKFGYINGSGEIVFAAQFDSAHQFNSDGIARIDKRLHPIEQEKFP